MKELIQDILAQQEAICVLGRTADFNSISTSTTFVIPWDVDLFDPWSMHDPAGANPSRLIIPDGIRGIIGVCAGVYWNAITPGANTAREFWLSKNGSIILGAYDIRQAINRGQTSSAMTIVGVEPGDYIEASCWHDTGVVNSMAYDKMQLSVFRIGRRSS